ncbi:MAG: glycosyltransferase, partial [Betaproteobacteria bacterium]
GLRSGVEATQDTAALEQTLHGVVVQSALPDLEVCVVTEASRVDPARVVLQRIAPAGAVVRASSIVPVAPGLSFAATLRSLIAEHPGRDVALIAPGALLPFAWDARLSKAVEAGPDIAAAIPMCDTSPLFALVDERFRGDPRAEAARIDRSAYCLGDRVYYEVPALHPVCVWLRRDMLESALPRVLSPSPDPQPALDELARWWRATGACCVICDYLYVGLAGATAPQPAPGDLDATAYLRDHPLGGLRRAVNDAIERGLAPASIPGLDHRPVQLHIMHFWGGGTETWVRDFGRADASRVNMILATYRIGETGGQRVVLYSDPDASIPVRTFDIARPIRSTAVGSIEYRRILVQIIAEFNIEAIIVSSLIGHTLDVLRQPVKTLIVCHDFYPVCQAINPLFGTTCVRCTQDDLRRCARSNPLNNFFDDQTPDEWHAMREIYVSLLLERSIPIVVPSPSVAATLRSISPRLLTVPMHVVPHGIDLAVPRIEPAQRSADEPLRVVVLGRMSERKGSKLLHAAAEGLRGLAEITLVGCGEGGLALARDCGWPSIERYEPDALPGLLRDIAPHAGLLASIIPESFSYTLSELSALGIPPLVTALGSFRDRVVDGENGFLFEPDKSALVALVRRLHAQPGLLAGVARRLAALPRGRTTAQMIDDYHALLPLAPQPIARFHLGIGRQTGLSEPYRHLTEAYAALTEAYTQTRAAYNELTGVLTHPWRIGKALRLFAALGAAFREKIGMHGRAPPRIGGRGK